MEKENKNICVYDDTISDFIATGNGAERSPLPSLTSENKGNKTNDVESHKKKVNEIIFTANFVV